MQILVTGPDLHILSKAGRAGGRHRPQDARCVPGLDLLGDRKAVVQTGRGRRAVPPNWGLPPSDVADQAYYAMGGGLTERVLPSAERPAGHDRRALQTIPAAQP